jgi:hypothetical protein
MSRLLLGTVCGIAFGILDVLLMIPIPFGPEKDKETAMAGAFVSRFAIGFVTGAARLPLPGWAAGLVFGSLISLPDAIITGSYMPIIPIGALGGALIGFIVGRWGKDAA